MDTQQAHELLGLENTASDTDITNALVAKRAQITQKREAAPTEALKAKFDQLLAQLDQAEAALKPAKKPASLSQTKLADLPSMAPGDTEQLTLNPGQTLAGRYKIEELLGQGGMGAVYRAWDANTERAIALKLLLPSLLKNASARERFMSEARISQQLSHPNIVNVYDVQQEGDRYFLTMELLEGQDLRQWLENLSTLNQPVPVDEAKRIVGELCDALSYAHEHTVHRDIKPENIWLDEKGRVKLMDFGIARVQSASQRTQTGAAMGTAYYMAPEQLQGRELDARADIYAVGVMLYEMLTGQIPAGRFEPAVAVRKDIGKAISQVIDKALAVNPEQRYASAAELKQALLSGKPGKVANAKTLQAPALPWGAIAAGVLVVLLGGGLLMSGAVDVKSLLPASKEELAAQKATVARAQGEIKVLKERLNNGRRQLDTDLKDAQRNKAATVEALAHWQQVTENAIFAGNQITKLEGELSMAETLLRENAFAPAQASVDKVKSGYQALWDNFLAGETLYEQEQTLEELFSQWSQLQRQGELGDPEALTQAEAARQAARQQGLAGDLMAQNKSLKTAATQTQQAIDQAQSLLAVRAEALQGQTDWAALKKDYGLQNPPQVAQAEQAQQQAQATARQGQLAAAEAPFSQASELWQAAREAVVGEVAKADKQRQAQRAAAAAAAAKARAEAEARLARLTGKLVSIPAGSFMMGSSNGDGDEKPVHRVSIQAFKMMEHEVTWAQYQPCIDAGACPDNNDYGGDNGWGKGNRPVIEVSWNDITQHYIPWLNSQTGQRFRLPTEAEWEYAARAGSTGDYSWGNGINCSQARYGRRSGGECSNRQDGTVPVKSFSPNAFGLYDMHGNVWEWVQDCLNVSYSGAPADGRAWTSGDCGRRVLRGGSWSGTPASLRSAYRDRNSAGHRDNSNGFRLVQAN